MMDREWRDILRRYGQIVTVYGGDGEGRTVRAFLQPMREKNTEQLAPSPLGLRPEDRLLYLGPKDVPLSARESRVEWNGNVFDVQSAHPAGPGDGCHWWAVLRPRDERRDSA